MLVTDGIIRVRHRHSVEVDELLTPGEVVEVDIDLWSTSLIFNAGHCLRVDLSSSNAPRFQPNPNTGEAFASKEKVGVPAENTLYFDAAPNADSLGIVNDFLEQDMKHLISTLRWK